MQIARDLLYAGNEQGAVELYNVSSLSYGGIIPFNVGVRESASILPSKLSQDGQPEFPTTLSTDIPQSSGPKVSQVLVDSNVN